jgi:hypothetical protein
MFRRTLLVCCCDVAMVLAQAVFAQVGVLPKNDVSLKDGTDEKFKVGDVWEYETRTGEDHSRLTIVKIDESPDLGVIVHVGADNLRFSNCHGGPAPEAVPHMPFSRRALDASVKKRVASKQPLPKFQPGYEEWRTAYSKGKAGVYAISVAAAVSVAEKTFRAGIECE